MKIVVGYEGSKVCKKALDLAKVHAKVFGAKIHVLNSLEGGSGQKLEETQEARKNLEYAKNNVEKDGIACETHLLVQGQTPGEDIVQYAQENNADEIVMGVRNRTPVGKFLLGSNAQHIVLHAPCPVVTVRP